MDPAPTIETVLHALRALYHSPNTLEKEQASKWLENFQKSVFAWSIADQLLAHRDDPEACYFAAHTIKTKIQHHFYELPGTSHHSLRDSLLNHISSCDSQTSVVVTQLSLAIADLALLMAAWENAVADLLTKFAPNPASYPVLLEILTVLPEELMNKTLRIGANRRAEVTEQLSKTFEGVHQFLVACLSGYYTDQQLCGRLFKCLGSWFSVGAVPDGEIRQSPLLEALFHYLMDLSSQSTLHEAATDCLCSALYKCEDMTRYGHLAQSLFERIMNLSSTYAQCAAQSDTDRCLNFARIFTEMAESFLEALIQFPNKGLGNFSQLELICSTLDNEAYEVTEISFNFWYSLSEHLYQVDDTSLNSQFSPYVQKLILALCKHVQLDQDHDGILEQSEDFYDFRLRTSDLIKDVIFIVSSTKLFRELLTHLNPSLTWNVTESYLFVMTAIAGNMEPKEDIIVPHVINLVLTEYCNPPVRHHAALTFTCISLLGGFKEWIKHNPQILNPALQLLLSCLRIPKLSNMAATSLDLICTECMEEKQMMDNLPTLLQVVKDVDSFHITTDGTVRLIKAAAVILSKFPNEQLLCEGIRELCKYQVVPLEKLVEDSSSLSSKDRATKKDPGFWLDRLTSVVRYGVPAVKNGHHPCYQVIAELWATFAKVCNRYQSDVKTIEKCCRCIRFAIRNLGGSFTPLLEPLVTLMVSLYSQHLHSCYLYLGAILVDVFGANCHCIKGLLHMTEALAMPTFELLSKPNGLVLHSDTVDDFFRLCLRFLQRDRLVLLSSSITSPMLKCAIAAATLQHRDANASVMRFLVEMFNVPSPSSSKKALNAESTTTYTLVAEQLQREGPVLVDTLLQCCVSALPSSLMIDVADVFMSLLTFDRPSVSTWLENSLKSLPTESTGGVVTATAQQLKNFHSGVTSATDARDITPMLKDFLILYR